MERSQLSATAGQFYRDREYSDICFSTNTIELLSLSSCSGRSKRRPGRPRKTERLSDNEDDDDETVEEDDGGDFVSSLDAGTRRRIKQEADKNGETEGKQQQPQITPRKRGRPPLNRGPGRPPKSAEESEKENLKEEPAATPTVKISFRCAPNMLLNLLNFQEEQQPDIASSGTVAQLPIMSNEPISVKSEAVAVAAAGTAASDAVAEVAAATAELQQQEVRT